ncbi:hypothetical protein GCM10007148_25990 [Parvularcula lutaonensis]|nr:hypothetical protein GCM10007148_25990 [Parvularcula lutaonensis]
MEEQNYGRALALDTEGNIVWQYVNRASDGKVYLLRWSRFVPPEQAAELRKALAEIRCSAE